MNHCGTRHAGEAWAIRVVNAIDDHDVDAYQRTVNEFLGRCVQCTSATLECLVTMAIAAFDAVEIYEADTTPWREVLLQRLSELLPVQ